MGIKAVLIRISTQEIIKKGDYPSSTIEPIPSLDADLEWLIINEIDKPVYDSEVEKIVKTEEITTEAHPVYTTLNQYKIYYNIVPFTQQEIDVKEKEKFKNDITGAFAFATTPDGTKEYAIKIDDSGKLQTVLIP